MNLHIRQSLLFAATLVVLSACSTTDSKPVINPVPPSDQSTKPTSHDMDTADKASVFRYDSAGLSLADIDEMSKSIVDYQPDRILAILRALESVPSKQLHTMIESQSQNPELTEWLELALQMRSLLVSGAQVKPAARVWENYHFGHVVTQAGYADLLERYRGLFSTPSQVAILLPAQGGLANAGKAIRDGIISAYLEQSEQSSIRFYSSGENDESAIAAYRRAVDDGATQIIGPLRIDSTRALAGLANVDVPVLLLNKPAVEPDQRTDRKAVINSLSLSQTDEAAAIADKALKQELDRAIVITPNNAWGERIRLAFSEVYVQGGGSISDAAHYDPAISDHSAMLTRLLRIDESNQRKADLQARLGIPMVFEPIRREDFDFVFLAAEPDEGRELKPLLKFHNVGDIPVYAMSRIFSGRPNRGSDQDLNGVVFAATPWQLNASEDDDPNLDSLRGGTFGNLYALGQDAWNLLPWLDLMQKDPDLWFAGNTGHLRLQSNGDLFREPAWAQFSSGRPVPYQWPDSP